MMDWRDYLDDSAPALSEREQIADYEAKIANPPPGYNTPEHIALWQLGLQKIRHRCYARMYRAKGDTK